MAYRERGTGSFTHIKPLNCKACKDYETCQKRDDKDAVCSRRDRRERWVYQYYVPGPDGKPDRKSLTAKSREKLKAKILKMEEAKAQVASSVWTLGWWIDTWLETFVKGTVKVGTYNYYKYVLQYVSDDLRAAPLSSVTPGMCMEFFNHIYICGSIRTGKALSTTTVRGVRNSLKTCMEAAVDQGYIAQNPLRKTKPLRDIRKEKLTLTAEEAKRLQQVADTGAYRNKYCPCDDGNLFLVKQWPVVIRTALASGLRRGEIFGLSWSDVDFGKGIIRVRKNLNRGKLEDVKTVYSIRDISLDKKTLDRLREWCKVQSTYAASLGDKFPNDLNLVFTNMHGRPVDVDNFRARVFLKMCKAAGLPYEDLSLHNLRHTHATMLLHAGVDANTVSKRLGHSSVSFTLQTYCHTTDAVDSAAATMVGSLLDD
jgi:integrase